MTRDVATVPGVAAVSPMRYLSVSVNDDRGFAAAVDPAALGKAVPVDFTSGLAGRR